MNILHNLYKPEFITHLIQTYGYALLFAFVFAETGLLVGFFLPGDSLLFLAGAAAALPQSGLSIVLLWILLCIAAIAGDGVGYLIGRKVGAGLLTRPDSRLFKRKHVEQAQNFYEEHGPKAIILARFVPIVRTFVPTVAGVAGMHYRKFATYNVFGGIGWVSLMLVLGYFLGSQQIVKNNLEKATLFIVFLSILPMIVHYVQERRKKSA